mgnify:CR=1 FL=1
MDDYQEELLELQAFELDPLDPAEDATELSSRPASFTQLDAGDGGTPPESPRSSA